MRYLLSGTVLLAGLALFLVTSGCSKTEGDKGKELQPDDANHFELPPDIDYQPKRDKASRQAKEDPALIVPLEQEASFMGTRGRGRRFCIIADASNSMKGAPIKQLKKEILQTLDGLKATSSFYIILFNATDIPMPYSDWLAATKENVDKARTWFEGLSLALYTKPTSAFERAFKLSPKPDVIFFMTDGFLQGFTPDQVKRLNASEPKVVVHTLMFLRKDTEKATTKKTANVISQLRSLAEQNGGTFRRVSQK